MAGRDWQDDSWFVDEWHGDGGRAGDDGWAEAPPPWAASDRASGAAPGQVPGGQAEAHPPWAASDRAGGPTGAAPRQAAEAHPSWAASDRADPWVRPKPKRGRLLVGFALGAATVLAVQFGSTALSSPPVAVVGGTAHPAAGAAAPAARPSTPAPPPATAPSAAPAAQTSTPPTPPPQRPGTVRLPAGGTATLVRKDLGPDGELPVPEDLGQATWWGAGLDAAGGASVFAGHVNWRGATGPFAELWTAGIGAVVTIVDSGGKTWRFRISQLVTVHKDDLPARADDLFGQSGPHRVVLVTCGGRWVGGSDGYEENRVVVADPA